MTLVITADTVNGSWIHHFFHHISDELHHLWDEFTDDLKDVEIDLDKFVDDDLEPGLKELANVIKNLPQDLYQLNDELCTKVVHCNSGACAIFSSIAEKLEEAAINYFTGGAFSILIEGVDISNEVAALMACKTAQDVDQCKSQALLAIMEDTGSIIGGIFGVQSNLAKDFAKIDNIVVDSSKLALEIIHNKQNFEDLIKNLKDDQVTLAEAEAVVNTFGDILTLLSTDISAISSVFDTGKINNVLQALEKGVFYLQDADQFVSQIFVNGISIEDDLHSIKKDWESKNYVGVAQQIGDLVDTIAEAMGRIPALKGVASSLLKYENLFISIPLQVEADLARDYQNIEGMISDVETFMNSKTASNAKTVLQDFQNLLSTMLSQLQTIPSFGSSNPLLSKLNQVIQRLEKEIPLIEKDDSLAIDGVDIIQDIQNLVSDWKDSNWSGVGEDIGEIIDSVHEIIPKHFEDMISWIQSAAPYLNCTAVRDLEKISQDIELAFNKLYNIWNDDILNDATKAEADLKKLATILSNDVAPLVSAVDPKLGANISRFASILSKDLNVISDVSGRVTRILIEGKDVSMDIQKMFACAKAQNFACAGQNLGQLISTVLKG